MISGNLSSPQDLAEILSGLPGAKSGFLNLLSRNLFLSLALKGREVEGFYTNAEAGEEVVPESLLLYTVAELLLDTEGYFSFEEETAIEEFTEVSTDLESLVIRATILRKELDEVLPHIITTSVRLRSEEKAYEGKTLLQILTSSEDPVREIRRLKKLLGEGKVEIADIRRTEGVEEIGLDYVLEGVEYGKVNLFHILESLKSQGFTGFVEIEEGKKRAYVFFKGGKIFGAYPAKTEIFDLFLNTFGNLRASVVKIKEEFADTFAQAFVGRPLLSGEEKYLSLGKLFLTLLSLKEKGTVRIEGEEGTYIFIFKEGKMLSARRLERWSDNWRVLFKGPLRLYLYRGVHWKNVRYLFYLFLINKILHLLRKHGEEKELEEVITFVARKPNLYLEGGEINPSAPLGEKDEEELLALLSRISEVLVRRLGRRTFEEELENELSPYRDVLRILDLEEELSTARLGEE